MSGKVWKSIRIAIDLNNVTVELLYAHKQGKFEEVSMARLDFIKSKLLYESFSDDSKDIDLRSQKIEASDTRYRGIISLQTLCILLNSLIPTSFNHSNKKPLEGYDKDMFIHDFQ